MILDLSPREIAVFAPLASPQVIEQLTPAVGAEFHPAKFLRENGALYLLGTSSGASATANFVSALIEDVVETARQLAGGSAGARLDPPLALILDEAANYPLPSLGALMSEGGGTGITDDDFFVTDDVDDTTLVLLAIAGKPRRSPL